MLKRAAENRERKRAKSPPGTATSGGPCSRGHGRKPRQHRGNGQKKSQPDKGWDFTLWWRRRESNPRPQALCRRFYMCSLSFDLTESPADRQALLPAIPKGFSDLASGRPHRDPVRYDARNLNAPARLQSDGTLLGFKQRVRSCRRWQLIVCRWIYEVTAPRHAPSVSRPTSNPCRPRWKLEDYACCVLPYTRRWGRLAGFQAPRSHCWTSLPQETDSARGP